MKGCGTEVPTITRWQWVGLRFARAHEAESGPFAVRWKRWPFRWPKRLRRLTFIVSVRDAAKEPKP